MSESGQKYIAFLRGINVGGRHKVPMAELRKMFESLGYKNVKTLLNSGNVIFECKAAACSELEAVLAPELEKTFGFSIPVMVRSANELLELIESNPFGEKDTDKEIVHYITFLKEEPRAVKKGVQLPGFEITAVKERIVCSVVDRTRVKTPDAMSLLQKHCGTEVTTRNMNTVLKAVKMV